jgi:hypothetical protein
VSHVGHVHHNLHEHPGNLPLFGTGIALSVPVYALLQWIVPG